MTLKEETLQQNGRRQYEEPDGEYLELIESGNNTLTVLTRVNSDKAGVESSPVDPSEKTVSELKSALGDSDYDWNDAALRGLLDAEKRGKERTTAINAIEERLQ